MDTKKIEVLLRAVENGSLLTTAEQLGYTQAGLTQMMKSLERELDLVLLERGKFGVRFTEEGKALLPYFEEMRHVDMSIRQCAARLREKNADVIRLGAVASVIRTWLPDVISAFQKANPGVSIEVKEGDQTIYRWFDEGQVDVCITCNIVDRKDFEPLMTDEFFACLPPDYPLPEGETFPLKRFEEEPYLSASCGEDYDVQTLLDRYGVHPRKQNTRVDDASVISMVSRGLGVSLIPHMVLQSSKEPIRVAPLDLPCRRRIGVIHRKPQEMSPVMRAFVAFLKAWPFA